LGGYQHGLGNLRDIQRGETVRMLTSTFQPMYQHLDMSQSLASISKTPETIVSSPNFKVIFEKALKAYKTKTNQDLTAHPLASELHACNSPTAILTILQDQVHQFEQSRSADERLRRWLNPTINVLYAFSETLGRGVGLVHIYWSVWDIKLMPILKVFSPAQVISAGAGVLLLVSVSFAHSYVFL
jgi:hypothetical protein